MKKAAYPLTFAPLYRPAPWGGFALGSSFGRETPAAQPIGESLELVDDGENQSLVANGPLTGSTLHQVASLWGTSLVGSRYQAGSPFPLFVKFLVSGRRLPLQVHPDELTAEAAGAAANTKMWYLVTADNGSQIYVGIKPRYTQQQFLNNLRSAGIEDVVQDFPAIPGDAYYISAGRVHALGAGILALSIEQRPALSIPLSTWGEEDPDYPLDDDEVRHGLTAIHFQDRTIARIRCESSTALRNRKLPLVNLCPQFTVDELRLAQPLHDRTDGSSFHHLVAIDGKVEIAWDGGELALAIGQSCLIPANLGYYSATPAGGLTKVIRSALRN